MKKLVIGSVVGGLAALIGVLGGGQLPAHAEQSTTNNLNTLKISPVRRDIKVSPGKSGTVTMRVTNLTKKPLKVRPLQNDFISRDEVGSPALILDEDSFAPTHSLKRFMEPLKDITIPGGKHKEVTLKISVPKKAQAGGYYGAIRFTPLSDDGSKSLNLNASAASMVLLTVPGDLHESVALTDFTLRQKGHVIDGFTLFDEKLSVMSRFENKGNIQAAPFGQIYIKKGDDVVFKKDFNQDQPRDNILPDSARRWTTNLTGLKEFGKYEIGAVFTYGQSNKTIEVNKTLWVVPLMYVIVAASLAVLIIAAIIVAIVLLRKRRQRSPLRSTRHAIKHRR